MPVATLVQDPVAARSAVNEHLKYVEHSLVNQQKAEENEAVARQRYEHEQSR